MQYKIRYSFGTEDIVAYGPTKHTKGDIINVDGKRYRVIVAGVQTQHVAGDGTTDRRPMQTLYGEWID